MLKYSQIKLSRLIGLTGNSKRHATDKTTASVLAHDFRDPVQVDLIFLDDKHQRKGVDEVLADDSIKLTLVEGHDRTLNVCRSLFKSDPDNPPGNIELVKNKNGRVVDWLIPATVARSESRAKAVAYSIDHNATTAGALGDEAVMELFNSTDLCDQLDELLVDNVALAGFDLDLASLSEALANADYPIDDEETGDEYDEAAVNNTGDSANSARGGDGDNDDDLSDLDDIENTVISEEIRVKLGDIWELGDHRLICGDSLLESTVNALTGTAKIDFVWSDPPYGINIVRNNSVGGGNICATNVYSPIAGDQDVRTAIEGAKLYLTKFPDAIHLWWGANYYAHILPPSPCWFVWDKNNTGNFADCELAWLNQSSAAKLFKHTWNGMIKDSEHGQRRCHPTQKPVALAVEAFNLFGTKSGAKTVLDPFLGSGISILAGERMGLTVYGIELSPEYCSITLDRWEKMTGQTASLIYRE